MNFKITAMAVAASLVLTACGGGGGSSPTPTPTPAPTPTPTPTPAPVVLAAVTQTAMPPAYPITSHEMGVFTALAAFRAALGLGPLNQDARIDIAAKNHSDYIAVTFTGLTPHHEEPGKPGFTGVLPVDRMIAAGYPAVDGTEGIGFTGPENLGAGIIEGLVSTVYHRVGLMDQTFTDVGIAPSVQPAFDGSGSRPTYIDIGVTAAKKQNTSGDYIGFYPVNGQSGVGVTHAAETPNPFSDLDGTADSFCAKTSYPIHLASQKSTKLSVTSFTVTEDGQTTPLAVRLMTSTSDKVGIIPQHAAFIVGMAPFKLSTKYNVRFVGTATGAVTGAPGGVLNIDKAWSFTTNATPYRCK
jgi:uncharacterized protein YkwD